MYRFTFHGCRSRRRVGMPADAARGRVLALEFVDDRVVLSVDDGEAADRRRSCMAAKIISSGSA